MVISQFEKNRMIKMKLGNNPESPYYNTYYNTVIEQWCLKKYFNQTPGN